MVIAAYFLVVSQLVVAGFQLALVLGAPLGEMAMGGQTQGKLTSKMRSIALVNLFVNLAIGGHYLAQTGLLSPLLPAPANTVVNWVFVGFFTLGLILNSISRSKKERQLWVPVLVASVAASVWVALG